MTFLQGACILFCFRHKVTKTAHMSNSKVQDFRGGHINTKYFVTDVYATEITFLTQNTNVPKLVADYVKITLPPLLLEYHTTNDQT